MVIENQKNRDLFLKFCFIYFLNHILRVLGIDEEIEDTLTTEYITLDKKDSVKIFDSLLDFAVITKSNKIIIFEFKKNTLRKKDLKQVYDYYRQIYCKEKTDTIAIVIVISRYGKIEEYIELDITYHPRIIKTKQINKQKDLKIIREKFNDNQVLTSMECCLLTALPLFELNESESEIIEEICFYIKNRKHCIPHDMLEEIVLGMYFNIIEYIPEDRQEDLMEVIDMNDLKSRGDFAKLKKEQEQKGIEKGIEKTILKLLILMTPQEISQEYGINLKRVLEIKNQNAK